VQHEKVTVGVLALQGAFHLHKEHVLATGAKYKEVTSADDLTQIDGLIIPGGESSVMLKLIDSLSMGSALYKFVNEKPAWGICAGAILLAKEVTNPTQKSFGAIDIAIRRNGYGRQLDSFEEEINGYQVAYIRAPIVTNFERSVAVHHRRGADPTWVSSEKTVVTTFHPETNRMTPSPWHHSFVKTCSEGS